MGKIVLTRVDEKLIHGVTCSVLCPYIKANKIVAVDDVIAKDDFLSMVYKGAAPSGVTADIYTVADVIEGFASDTLGDGNILLIFKTIEDAYNAFKNGVKFDSLQLGTSKPTPDRKRISSSMSINEEEVKLCRSLVDDGVDVYIQLRPDNPRLRFEDCVKGVFK